MARTPIDATGASATPGNSVLVTGGLGFIGSNLVRRLVAAGARVTVIDAAMPGSGANPANLEGVRCDVVRASLADAGGPAGWERHLKGVATVFHLAAQTGHAASMTEPVADLDQNARSTLNLLQACREHCPSATVVFTSTRQVYGRPKHIPVSETHPVDPPDVNAVHKLAAEHYVRLYDRVHGLRGVSLRLTNVYGPGMRIKDGRQMFLGVWVRSVLEGKPFEVWGGEQKRDLLHVDDAVDALLAVAQTPETWGRTFNVGRSDAVSLRALADHLVAANGGGTYTVKPMPPERAAIDVGDYATDASALRNACGWQPKVDLQDGLRRTLGHFRTRLRQWVEAAA